jgi:hypothetical protein
VTENFGADDWKQTPDELLHTGTEHQVDAEDVVLASGRDVTPERLERAQQLLHDEGAAGVEKLLP